ncbi:hypothetical protein MHYP_G00027130 [Metynnis hypsauchen]
MLEGLLMSFWKEKKIPEDLPYDLATKEQPIPDSFKPLEMVCPYCPGPCPPALDESRLVTAHGTVFCIFSVTKDANWKTAFDVPVHLLKRPTTANSGPDDIQVNIKTRWEMLEKEIIASGFFDDTTAINPFTSMLPYSAFTPWVGKHTRVHDVIPKTEIVKGLSEKEHATLSQGTYCIDEDAILSVLESKMPKKEDLIAACNALGVSEVGSRSDLINRLEELLLYKDVYPKMFVKLQKTGGGVLHMGCIHSVVYYESARDHGDALLSFRQPPTVYISDIAGRVARHRINSKYMKDLQRQTKEILQLGPSGRLTFWIQERRHVHELQKQTEPQRSPGSTFSVALFPIEPENLLQSFQNQGFRGLQMMRLILVLPRLPKRNKTVHKRFFGHELLGEHLDLSGEIILFFGSMHPTVKTIQWVQCDYCDGWLHSERAGIGMLTFEKDAPFSCGCHLPEPYQYESTQAAARKGQVVELVADEEILLEAIIERTFTVLQLDRSKLQNTSFVLEVMAPEITILILKKLEGFNRFQAETTFARHTF